MGDDRVPGTQPGISKSYVCPACGLKVDAGEIPVCPNDGAEMELSN
jgi:ABC-type ATPase with predicted acetyltransferase domain